MPLLSALFLALLLPLAALAAPPIDDAGDVCPAAADPCFVTGDLTVVDLATLDFGARHLVVKQGKRLDAGGGTMTVKAGRVTIEPGGALLGSSGNIMVITTGPITVQRTTNAVGRVDVAGEPGGNVELRAGGDITIQGLIDLSAKDPDQPGGFLLVDGRDVLIAGTIDSHGGNSISGSGGSIDLNASGTLTVTGHIDSTGGGDGGDIEVTVGGQVSLTGIIETQGTGNGASAGGLVVTNAGSFVELGGTIRLKGNDGSDDFGGGSGGELFVRAEGSIQVSGAVDLSGATPGGDAGTLDLDAPVDITFTHPVVAATGGSNGFGGTAFISAGRNLRLDDMDLTGRAFGGFLEAEARCFLEVPVTAFIDTRGGPGIEGLIKLASGDTLTIAGTLQAGQDTIFITLPPIQPIIQPSAVIVPPPQAGIDPLLQPCNPPPPPGCGDGVTQANLGEECDDQNQVDCGDGCSNTCKLVGCGNGRVEANCGEACDDQNTLPCDGCSADCARPSPVCGDGILECPNEQAETESPVSCDGDHVSAVCMIEACGNGVQECDEECDDGPTGSATCVAPGQPNACHRILATCGTGGVQAGEECDGGESPPVDCDGCSHLCQLEGPGNGVIECGEACDDLNTVGCDGCSPTGKLEVCGDGVQDCGEECDAGAANGTLASGCTLGCVTASVCRSGGPSQCLPCGSAFDCAPTGSCSGTRCLSGTCVPGPAPSCGDASACTADTCDPVAGCVHTPIACAPDASACTTDACDATRGCVHDPITCADTNACTDDGCDAATGCTFTPRRCDDGNACTDDGCDPATGCTAVARRCDDGNACTVDGCSPSTGCTTTPRDCSGTDSCVTYGCDPASGCLATDRPGPAGARCRLDQVSSEVGQASADRVSSKVRQKLMRVATRAIKAADAIDRAKTPKQRSKKLKAFNKQLNALRALVLRFRGAGLDPALADQVTTRLERAAAAAQG